ncbi:hypothetical protein GC176_04460 [bacterium]|nr:hypothetical protein [bacterium]
MQFLPRLIGIVPLGVGLSVLGFTWGGGMDGGPGGGPPVFFKLFFSFVALGFVLFGLAAFFGPSLLKGQRQQLLDAARDLADVARGDSGDTSQQRPQVGYRCPNCGADLGDGADVSPSGDVKCDYCKRWFNIHQS